VPIAAIGVAAPAFAASPSGAPVTTTSKSCKCAGNGPNNYDFKTVLSFDGTAGSWTVVINAWSFDGETQPNPSPNSFLLTNGKGDIVLKVNKTNSSARHDAVVTYTITSAATGISTTQSMTLVNFVYPPNCPGIGC
jgi:hypothetical protein